MLKADSKVVKLARQIVLVVTRAVAPFTQTLRERLERWTVPDADFPRGPSRGDWMPPPPHAHLTLVFLD